MEQTTCPGHSPHIKDQHVCNATQMCAPPPKKTFYRSIGPKYVQIKHFPSIWYILPSILANIYSKSWFHRITGNTWPFIVLTQYAIDQLFFELLIITILVVNLQSISTFILRGNLYETLDGWSIYTTKMVLSRPRWG